MILHTIINSDDIFYTAVSSGVYNRLGNCLIETYDDNGTNRIRSIFSTNPYDYLNEKFIPNSKYTTKL